MCRLLFIRAPTFQARYNSNVPDTFLEEEENALVDTCTGAVSNAPRTPPSATRWHATPVEDAAADFTTVTGAAPVGSVDEEDEEDKEDWVGDGVHADGCTAADAETTGEDTDDEGPAVAAVAAPAVAFPQDAGCPPLCPPGWDAQVTEGTADDGATSAVVGSARTRRRAEVGVCEVESRQKSRCNEFPPFAGHG